jgi:hypothetical protein
MESKQKSRYISNNIKQQVLQKQSYTCANSPFAPALNLHDYKCLLWICQNGLFDESGYDFDHIDEHCITSDNSISNIQALCPNCHRVKTKKFMKQKQDFTTKQLAIGQQYMDMDEKPLKRKKSN